MFKNIALKTDFCRINERYLIIIPIRLKASRFPNKPFAKIGDCPCFIYLQTCIGYHGQFIFSYCDQEVKEYCKEMNLKFIMTDPNHKSGSDRIGEAVKKLEDITKFKFVINVQGDMPFISANHLQLLKEKLIQFQISTLACPFINIDEAKNSSKVKVTIDQLNYASNFSRILDSNLNINKNVFHHIGVYAYHKKFLLDFISMPQTQRELDEKLEQLRIIDTSKIGIS